MSYEKLTDSDLAHIGRVRRPIEVGDTWIPFEGRMAHRAVASVRSGRIC